MGARIGRLLSYSYSDISSQLELILKGKEDLSGKTADLFYLSTMQVIYTERINDELGAIVKLMQDLQCDVFLQEKKHNV